MSYAPFIQILSQSWSSIVNKEFCVARGDWPGTWENWQDYHDPDVSPLDTGGDWMCGTGPYKLDYWIHGDGWYGEYSLVKFDDYWQGWPAPDCSNYVSSVIMNSIPPWPVKKEMFLNGTADIIYVPRERAEELEGAPGIRYIKDLPILSCIALFFNFNISSMSPYVGSGQLDGNGIPLVFFSDIDVRKAFAYSFNYTQYIEEVYLGEATQPATPVMEGLAYRNPDQEKYSLNLTMAEEHFRAAWDGQLWENGFNMTVPYTISSTSRPTAVEILEANIESLNPKFHIDLFGVTWSEYLTGLVNLELPLFIIGWLADYPDPHNFVYPFMHSQGDLTYFQNYSNALADELIEEGLRTRNTTRRNEIYYELQQIYHDDVPSVPVAQPLSRHWEREWVQGWYYNPAYPGLYFYHLWKGLDGDINGDNRVDIRDAGLINAYWYPGPPTGPLGYNRIADISPVLAPDGKVNILDASYLNAHWGGT